MEGEGERLGLFGRILKKAKNFLNVFKMTVPPTVDAPAAPPASAPVDAPPPVSVNAPPPPTVASAIMEVSEFFHEVNHKLRSSSVPVAGKCNILRELANVNSAWKSIGLGILGDGLEELENGTRSPDLKHLCREVYRDYSNAARTVGRQQQDSDELRRSTRINASQKCREQSDHVQLHSRGKRSCSFRVADQELPNWGDKKARTERFLVD